MEVEILSICRICMVSDEDSAKNFIWFNIFQHTTLQGNSITLADAMKTLTGCSEVISPEDGISHEICDVCFQKLSEAYEFSLQISQSAERLRNIQTLDMSTFHTGDLLSIRHDGDDEPYGHGEPDDNSCVTMEHYVKTEIVHDEHEPPTKKSTPEEVYNCPNCLNSFETFTDYAHHITKCKTLPNINKKPKVIGKFRCLQCPESFKTKKSLMHHAEEHNLGAITCDICGKTSKNSSALYLHKRIHDPSSWFKCSYCDKSFAQKGNMVTHTKKFHTDKPEWKL